MQSKTREIDVKAYNKRLALSRLRILDKHGFYGLMLMHMSFKLDFHCTTAYTDGTVIAFSPDFMDNLSDSELDFVLMHEVMHVALKHCFRGLQYHPEIFNIACDIVVNSNILKSNDMNINTIKLTEYGEAMHLTPSKEEGYLYSAEEVYEMLMNDPLIKKALKESKSSKTDGKPQPGNGDVNKDDEKELERLNELYNSFDDHSKWQEENDPSSQERKDEIDKAVTSAAESMNARKEASKVPLGVERRVQELTNPTIDWRLLLHDFIQEEVTDYSFNPPDKRYEDTGFFLPDFNDTSEKIDKVFFMIDTSGSITQKELNSAYLEIKGCLEQFEQFEGYVGFFDSVTYPPEPFHNVTDLYNIKPKGGGGTSFFSIFNYIKKNMEGEYPKRVIIITDGCAPFPSEEQALGIPILWLITNKIMTPKYGEVARIKMKK